MPDDPVDVIHENMTREGEHYFVGGSNPEPNLDPVKYNCSTLSVHIFFKASGHMYPIRSKPWSLK